MEVPGKVDREMTYSSTSTDVYCNPCSTEGKQEKVDGFCDVCKEYLCTECVSFHRKFRMTRNHVILEGSEIPTEISTRSFTCTENCTKHPDEFLKYFCHGHEEFCCGSCTLDHRQCKLDAIQDLAKDYRDSEEYKTLIADVAEINVTLNAMQELVPKFQKKAEDQKNKVSTKIDIFHENICEEISKLIDRLHKKADELSNKNEKQIKQISDNHELVHEKICKIQHQLQESSDSDIELFTSGKRLVKDTLTLKNTILEMKEHAVITQFSFKPPTCLEELAATLKSSGDILAESFDCQEEASEENKTLDWSNASLKLVDDFCIRHPDDKNNSFISGMCFVNADHLLFADYYNNALKLVDTISKSITSRLDTGGQTWDVTCLPEEQAAATIHHKKAIKIVSLKELTTVKDITVSGCCCGICYNEKQLIVSFNDPVKVEVMNLQGTVYRVISNDKISNPLYVNAHCSSGKAFMYVSDYTNGNLFKINICGEIISATQSNILEKPRKPTIFENNLSAVANYDSNYISLVSEDSGTMRVVNKLECYNQITGMAYSKAKKLFYTCSLDSTRDIVKVWSIEVKRT